MLSTQQLSAPSRALHIRAQQHVPCAIAMQQHCPSLPANMALPACSHVSTSNGVSTSSKAVAPQQRRMNSRSALTATGSSTAAEAQPSASSQESEPLITFQEVQQVARLRGLSISISNFGPFYRIICRQLPATPASGDPSPSSSHTDAPSHSSADSSDEGKGRIVAVTDGFVAPWFGLMHCDTLQVLSRDLKGDEGQRIRGTLGLGLLLGGATFSYGLSCGCSKAEILAINDDDKWHERLVRYYSYFGFKPVRKVGGNGLSDLPHMLVWGGEGMRMDADVRAMLRKWTPALRRSMRDHAAKQGQGQQ